jgi:hypothetical protein
MAQHYPWIDERGAEIWLLAIRIILVTLQDSRDQLDPLDQLEVRLTNPGVSDAEIGRAQQGKHLLATMLLAQELRGECPSVRTVGRLCQREVPPEPLL